jgi:hypothetical protein
MAGLDVLSSRASILDPALHAASSMHTSLLHNRKRCLQSLDGILGYSKR